MNKEKLQYEVALVIGKLRHILIDIEVLQELVQNYYLADARESLMETIDKFRLVKL
jgi:hypothetical protein